LHFRFKEVAWLIPDLPFSALRTCLVPAGDEEAFNLAPAQSI
jgi:hypothetical protein